MRLRITFAKTEAMRYTGHLDLHRTWERTIRRSGLPLAYTQGFRPHPRINLGCALPLGFTSQAEVVDIWLDCDEPTEHIEDSLRRAAPPGIEIYSLERADEQAPALQSDVVAAEYELTLLEAIPDLEGGIERLLAAESLPRQRRGKDYDLRPLILDLNRMPDDKAGNQRLHVTLSAREGATGRPEELVLALGSDSANIRVHRTRLVFQQQFSPATSLE
jgi:radical SAM-linked protein